MVEGHLKQRYKAITLGIVVTGVTLTVYLSLLSVHYDPNGIAEVMAIGKGDIAELFIPRRILYRAICYVYCQLLRLSGYEGHLLFPLQVLTGIFGALGNGLLFLILRRLIREDGISLLVTGGYAFSYGYWIHSEDVHYIIPATFFVLLAFYALVSTAGDGSIKACVLSAVSSALAICIWQANIFFLPVAIFWLMRMDRNLRSRLHRVVWYLFPILFIVGGLYLVIGYVVVGCQTVQDFVAWMTTYPTALPIWGVLKLSRFKESAITLVATIIPLHYGFGLRSLLKGRMIPGKIISLASLIALLFLLLGWGGWVMRNWRRFWARYSSWVITCLIWVIPYAAFNTWWDPYEVKWWLIPIVPFWISLGVVLNEVKDVWSAGMARLAVGLTSFALGIVILANLTTVILPHHSVPNVKLEKALVFGEFMGPQDLLVSAAWDWTLYVPYFTHRSVLNLISVSAEGRNAREVLNLEVANYHQRGGRVFLTDIYHYSDEQWAQLTYNTGLKMSDFENFERSVAWVYRGEAVWRITPKADDTALQQKANFRWGFRNR